MKRRISLVARKLNSEEWIRFEILTNTISREENGVFYADGVSLDANTVKISYLDTPHELEYDELPGGNPFCARCGMRPDCKEWDSLHKEAA